MKLSMFGCLIFLSLFLGLQNVEAAYSNNGRMESKNLTLSVGGTLDNNGELIGTESATISCDTLTGKGLISSPQIAIKTKIFAYTGKIDCSGKCTIITNKPFDSKMFKRKGGGEFVIIVDENLLNNSEIEYTITDGLSMTID